MSFNHFAKIKRILSTQTTPWYIHRIDQPTKATKFNGETVTYDHYYRIYSSNGVPIKYCKFQQIDRFAQIMDMNVEELPIVT